MRLELDLTESRHASKWHCDEKKLSRKEWVGEPYKELLEHSPSLAAAKAGCSQLSWDELVESNSLVRALQNRSLRFPRLPVTDRALTDRALLRGTGSEAHSRSAG